MKNIHILVALAVMTVLGTAARAHDKSAPLDADSKSYLTQYENVRGALAADDLASAKKAAGEIAKQLSAMVKDHPRAQPAADAATKLASAESLASAREAFKPLSKRAVHLVASQEGYYIANCPMVAGGEGDWVQTSKKISNPYFGKAMLTCGSIKE